MPAALPRRSARQPLADEGVHLGDVGRRRRQAGADRPDRLVGDHQIGGGRAVRQRAVELARRPRRASGRPRARLASRRRRRWRSAPPARRPAPWRAPARRFRDGRCGARNGRRSRRWRRRRPAFRPRYRRYGRRTASAWQSCAADGDPRSRARRRQMPRSASPAGRSSGRPCRRSGGAGDDLVELGRRGGEPVHLPIARHQRTATPWSRPIRRSLDMRLAEPPGCAQVASAAADPA